MTQEHFVPGTEFPYHALPTSRVFSLMYKYTVAAATMLRLAMRTDHNAMPSHVNFA